MAIKHVEYMHSMYSNILIRVCKVPACLPPSSASDMHSEVERDICDPDQ